MKKIIIAITILFLFSLCAGLIYINYQISNPKFVVYTNQSEKYSVKVPRGWQVQEIPSGYNFRNQVILTPGANNKIQNLEKIVILVVIPSANQKLSTKFELDDWLKKPAEKITFNKLQKVKNTIVAGQNAVILSDKNDFSNAGWNYITWFQYGDINYYIEIDNEQKITSDSIKNILYILSSFKFRT